MSELGPGESRALVAWAAGLSVFASLIHGAVTEEHLAEWWGYGLFFILAALAQAGYGFALVHLLLTTSDGDAPAWDARTRRGFYVAGLAGNGFLVALYLVTRTVGIPLFGPGAGDVEAFTPVSVLSKLVELGVIACLALLLARSRASARAAGAAA